MSIIVVTFKDGTTTRTAVRALCPRWPPQGLWWRVVAHSGPRGAPQAPLGMAGRSVRQGGWFGGAWAGSALRFSGRDEFGEAIQPRCDRLALVGV